MDSFDSYGVSIGGHTQGTGGSGPTSYRGGASLTISSCTKEGDCTTLKTRSPDHGITLYDNLTYLDDQNNLTVFQKNLILLNYKNQILKKSNKLLFE